MGVSALAAKARKHWAEWLPEKTRELKEAGLFQLRAQAAAVKAEKEILSLMQSGYQRHEAEEVVLPRYILLPPEGDGLMDEELDAELEERDREYHSWMDPIVRAED